MKSDKEFEVWGSESQIKEFDKASKALWDKAVNDALTLPHRPEDCEVKVVHVTTKNIASLFKGKLTKEQFHQVCNPFDTITGKEGQKEYNKACKGNE